VSQVGVKTGGATNLVSLYRETVERSLVRLLQAQPTHRTSQAPLPLTVNEHRVN
jgi:hypothetical protein